LVLVGAGPPEELVGGPLLRGPLFEGPLGAGPLFEGPTGNGWLIELDFEEARVPLVFGLEGITD